MKEKTLPLVVGNWKMHPASIGEAKKLFLKVREKIRKLPKASAIICPPAPFIAELRKLHMGKKISLGVQNVSAHEGGAHTGEIGAGMLASLGVTYAIVGHSERRAEGESDAVVAEKVLAARRTNLMPIICVGERVRDPEGAYLDVLRSQVGAVLEGRTRAEAASFIFAYEPVWAIGRTAAEAASSHEVHESVLFIRKVIREKFDEGTASRARILYGGSVEEANASSLAAAPGINGFLVGHASLEPEAFASIVAAAFHVR